MNTIQTTLKASNIKCGGCASAVRTVLGKLAGVQETSVNVLEQTVTVTHDRGTSRDELATTLTRAGFPTS